MNRSIVGLLLFLGLTACGQAMPTVTLPPTCTDCGQGSDIPQSWTGQLTITYPNGTVVNVDVPGVILDKTETGVNVTAHGCALPATKSVNTLQLVPAKCTIAKGQHFVVLGSSNVTSDPMSIEIVSADPTTLADKFVSFQGKGVLGIEESPATRFSDFDFVLELSR